MGYLDKYSEPKIFVINNDIIVDKMEKNYYVEKGDLGILKKIEFQNHENQKFVNLEYDCIDNLHEYKVIIIDLQNEGKIKKISESEKPSNPPYLFQVDYPMQEFDPTPLVIEHIKELMDSNSIRVVFANNSYSVAYKLVEVVGQNQVSYPELITKSLYATFEAGVENKSGKNFKSENNKLAQVISKYIVGYNVIFSMPMRWDVEQRKSVLNTNYIPLIYNNNQEVISYFGYSENTGYELMLPECKQKEKLISELFMQILPELIPDIFPESKEFLWLEDNYFKPKEILKCEEEKDELKKIYDEKLREIMEHEKKIYEQNHFLSDLLVETGTKLVEAICQFFEWLGFRDVSEVDGSEDILREDIQIKDDENLFIIEVKGIGGTSTDSECSQIAKHRRRREKENRDKNIIPIYIVNHQRFIKPQLRTTPPFSQNQIDYAQNDERGLLTTWQLYQQYRLIQEGVFTKEETMKSLKGVGLISLIPENLVKIGIVEEYYKKPNACIINISGATISCGDNVWAKKGIEWKKGKVINLQKNEQDISCVDNGEIGMVLDIVLSTGYEIFIYKSDK